MADNYTQFSEIIPCPTPEEQQWAQRVLTADAGSTLLKEAGIKLDNETWSWPGFQFEITEDSIWIYSEDSGDLDQVGEFVRAFLRRFRPDACWSLSWSETCSKPRIGEFAGGALFVTAKSVEAFNTSSFIRKRQQAFEKRIQRRCRAS